MLKSHSATNWHPQSTITIRNDHCDNKFIAFVYQKTISASSADELKNMKKDEEWTIDGMGINKKDKWKDVNNYW